MLGGLSPFLVNVVGQLAAFALLALSLDLIWGYAGILSLGHGLYFAVGGYIAAMHLLKSSYAATGILPDFLQFMGWSEFPSFWWGLESFPYALIMLCLVSGVVAFVFGYVSFRSRVGGVYFAIITQALVYVAMLLMFRNDTGFGGNNGMTGFAVILGFPAGSRAVTVGLAAASLAVLLAVLVGLRLLLAGRFGRLVLACRDDEVRLRTLGYRTLSIKLGVWCLSAVIAALAGMLYVPQVGIINPRLLSPELSIEIAVWVAIGGRGYLTGAVVGAVCVNALKFWLTTRAPELWPFILSGFVVIVVLLLPNGFADIGERLRTVRSGALRLPRRLRPVRDSRP
ncbi:urea ABC transporter permease subunit UrtC [Aurantimonas aggregata]|uniref:Urea ABC transporter permease subunit UrtC n=2 Tax=Aurantimonas aggregata TaxID=2047720 RepID=A0A6L9MJ71_9HYPH|nr:urea ABC transporter permease subunit UrtC [Aurantimonas aggregata]